MRDVVAAELNALSAPDGPLSAYSDRSTTSLYAADVGRYAFRRQLIEQYRERDGLYPDGGAAIITAGAPGAGKSTLRDSQVNNLADYRIIDADKVKDALIQQALSDDIYADRLATQLADGHKIAPRELAALVHRESVAVTEQARSRCVDRRENIVVEGTLAWQEQGPALFEEFATAGYSSLRVFAVEADRKLAHEQALRRWWTGRSQFTCGADALGGRFIPAESIDACYAGGEMSLCSEHAIKLIDVAQSGRIAHVHVTVFRPTGENAFEAVVDLEYP